MVPTVMFQALMFTLIGFGLFSEGSDHSEAMHLLIESFLIIYFAVTGLLNIVFITVTIGTWKTVHDNIHLREELILQTIVILITYIIFFIIYLCDQFDGDREQYDEIFYFGYFLISSLGSLSSIIIGTQFLHFRERQRERQRENRGKDGRSSGHIAGDRTQIAFRDVIAMDDGLEVFMRYLAKENEQIYLIVKCLVLRSVVCLWK